MLYLGGLSQLFVPFVAAAKFEVERKVPSRLDLVCGRGDYRAAKSHWECCARSITLTYGYSRDRRDLKQFVMNLVCWADGDIPAFIERMAISPIKRFAALMQGLSLSGTLRIVRGRSTLYSEENLQQLTGLRWLTRVPLTLKAASG